MLIRTRLTLYFAGLMAGLLLLVSAGVYLFERQSQQTLFYQRLQRKAEATAKVYQQKNRRLDKTDEILLLTQEKQHEAIFDETNTLVYSSGSYTYYPVSAQFLNQVRTERIVRFQTDNKLGVGMFFRGAYDRFTVIVTAEDTFGQAQLTLLLQNMGLVNVFGLLLVLGLAWLFSGRSLQPAQHLINDIRHLNIDRLSERLPTGNARDEIAQLSIQFNHLLSRLDKTVRQNRAFVTNASHELRTPLANLLGTLQVSLSHDQQPDNLRATLQSAIEEVQSLIRLANNLLLLAELGVENDASTLAFEDVLLTEPLLDAVQAVQRKYPDHTIDIVLPDDSECCQLTGNADLLTVALTNLLENACKYSPVIKPVQVRLQPVTDGSEYSVQDRGIGIPPDALPHLFTPLFRADNAHQTNAGHGVGLALVQRIAQLHGGRVSVRSELGTGTTFRLWLPTNKA
ncbi:histidine kinase (plasmid) [Fibrella aestuarina BUZ 2]|uniref:histidine kinase n=1 Tax=Fibrella aestuarina BUZ 2 TaxID=1166018 RepID=I0KHM3_9BACT|nr:ATP-binding protein [Fibrella aestuarina]CCH03626.1 histidine kinase [Fibrella aestuarina BUZ 2]